MRTRRREIETLVIATLALSCAPVPPPFAPAQDAYGTDAVRLDGGLRVAFDAGQVDAASFDAPDSNADAPAPDVGSVDGGVPPSAITVDGRFIEPIWTANAANPMLTNTLVATAPFDGDALTALYYARDHDWLYLGFEGALANANNAIVFYVDTAPSPPNGVFLMMTGLPDRTNVVNQVLSNSIAGTIDFQPEWGWGTSAMPIPRIPYEARIGWRLLSSVGSFQPLASRTGSACTATACETAVQLRALNIDTSAATPASIRLVVRMGQRDPTGFANPTFPTSDNGNPQAVGPLPVTVAP